MYLCHHDDNDDNDDDGDDGDDNIGDDDDGGYDDDNGVNDYNEGIEIRLVLIFTYLGNICAVSSTGWGRLLEHLDQSGLSSPSSAPSV